MNTALIIAAFSVGILILIGLAVLTTGVYQHWHVAKLHRREWDEE